MKIFHKKNIEESINLENDLLGLILSQKQAFIDFSAGFINMPMPLQMSFENPVGDCHVKAGFNEKDDIFVIKVATVFYQNKDLNLPAGDGVSLVFSKSTGLLKAVLCDNGYLTLLRTALAACVASQIAPVTYITVIGKGNLGQMITKLMSFLYPKATISSWNRNSNSSLDELLSVSDLVISATASQEPIIKAALVKKNVHIIALGADEPIKQELDPQLFKLADKVIIDSKFQAVKFGDSYHAIKAGIIKPTKLEELGNLLAKNYKTKNQIIITDLTGIAAQDIAIAKWVISVLQ